MSTRYSLYTREREGRRERDERKTRETERDERETRTIQNYCTLEPKILLLLAHSPTKIRRSPECR